MVYFVLLQNNLNTAPVPGVTDLINKQTYPETLLKGIIKVKKLTTKVIKSLSSTLSLVTYSFGS